ncbi:protein-disulfide reductase DsbD domain-containing protein [Candidatus Poriferisodalis sp.]|uniref:protein-disulfide reductase DsbD domain-containing protein n=1 Tax=Candidatus Poriferisodalis sp. TaxID=3101277 RepID=UPI003AF8ED87
MLAAALGQEFEAGASADGLPVDRVTADVMVDGDRLPMGVARHIVATFRVPNGQHLYGEPVPKGLVATAIELDDSDGILSYELLAPPTWPLTLAESGDTLQTYEGDVVLRLPVAQNARQMRKDDDGRYVTISGQLRWQACDDVECFLPESMPFSFRVDAGFPVLGDMGPGVGRVPAMNGAQHCQKLIDRRASNGSSADDE